MADLFKPSHCPPPVDKGVVATNRQARGFSCDTFVDPPGQQWLDFVHDGNELVTVVEGRLDMRIDDQQFLMKPRDEVFIPKGVIGAGWFACPA